MSPAIRSHYYVCLLLLPATFLFSTIHAMDPYSHPNPLSQLVDDYYSYSCPDAESVITRVVNEAFEGPGNLRFAAGIIRMAYHDCFVEGCDASILLDGNDTEKTAPVNSFLDGFEVIDAAKAALEAICPGVVSCADIIAFAARDSTIALSGTGWIVQGGRKDGVVSSAAAAEAEIPTSEFAVCELTEAFARRGLSQEQMVILSGSHTVGVSHCDKMQKRLYNFSTTYATDPSLDPSYAAVLKEACPQKTFNDSVILFLDFITPGVFDSNYYVTLEQHRGLLVSDQSLHDDPQTRNLVKSLARNNIFLTQFGEAMRAMGAVGVKTCGQIRRDCRVVNP